MRPMAATRLPSVPLLDDAKDALEDDAAADGNVTVNLV